MSHQVHSPFDQSLIGEYEPISQLGGISEKAQEGFVEWSGYTPRKRSDILQQAATLIRQHKEKLAELISQEIAKPISQSLGEVSRAADILALCAEESLRLTGELVPLTRQHSNSQRFTSLNYEPLGVVLAVCPFNFPLSVTMHKIAPALAAGNSVLCKPSPKATLIVQALTEILWKAGVAKNALLFIPASNEQVKALLGDDRVDFLNFTGNSKIGWYLKSIMRPGMRCLLELGGNAPVIVHEDADLEAAARACASGGFRFSGQSCISVQRVYVHQEVEEQFTRQLIKEASNLKIGTPLDKQTDISSLIDSRALQRIKNTVDEAVSQGAHLVYGGRVLDNNCYSPTVLTNVASSMTVLKEEIFGPVVSVVSYADLAVAIAEANNTKYGLSAGIFTQDLDIAFKAGRELSFGTVMINDSSTFRADEMPTGARKLSGLGLESPRYAMREMSQTKVISFNLPG